MSRFKRQPNVAEMKRSHQKEIQALKWTEPLLTQQQAKTISSTNSNRSTILLGAWKGPIFTISWKKTRFWFVGVNWNMEILFFYRTTYYKTIHSDAITESALGRLSRGHNFFLKHSYSVEMLDQSPCLIFMLIKYNNLIILMILGLIYTRKSDNIVYFLDLIYEVFKRLLDMHNNLHCFISSDFN